MNFIHTEERIYAEDADGKLLAEVTFPASGQDAVCIDHTFTDPSLRGQGIAGQLIEEVIDYAKEHGKKIAATCPYAVEWFQKHSEYAHLVQ